MVKCGTCGELIGDSVLHDHSKDDYGHWSTAQLALKAMTKERDLLLLQVSELQKKLAKIGSAVCAECHGTGEIGLADGDVHCPVCGGSGDPTRPGFFADKRKYDSNEHAHTCTPLGAHDCPHCGNCPECGGKT